MKIEHDAELIISASLCELSANSTADEMKVIFEIGMAYKMGLMTADRRDILVSQARSIVDHRRRELREERLQRIIAESGK